MLSDRDIYACYRAILGRKPESLEQIQKCKNNFHSIESLGRMLLNSVEFKIKYNAINGQKFNPVARVNSKNTSCLIFMHIPKCAGTTLHNILKSNFQTPFICKERHNGLSNFSYNELLKYQFFSGHFDYQSIVDLPHQHKTVITILRDPYERLVSLYNFLRSHKLRFAENNFMQLVTLSHKFNIYEFYQRPEIISHPSINNSYVRTLTTKLPYVRWESNYNSKLEFLKKDSLELALKRIRNMRVLIMKDNLNKKILQLVSDLKLDIPEKVEHKQVLTEIMFSNINLIEIIPIKLDNNLKKILNPLIKMDLKLYTEFSNLSVY